MSFYSSIELKKFGFAKYGENVVVSKRASIFSPERISLGNHVRIDDFCVLSAGEGGIKIGNFVHVAVFCALIGKGQISLGDFSGLSSRVSIYSSNEDYSGEYLTNPTVPEEYRGVFSAKVNIKSHVIIGSGSVILPGVTLNRGVVVGALSLIKYSCKEFGIYAGAPAKLVGERKRQLLEMEAKLQSELMRNNWKD